MAFLRWVLRGLAFVLPCWLLLELACWIALGVLQGEFASWGHQSARQANIVRAASGQIHEGAGKGRHRLGDVPHPYVGFAPGFARMDTEANFTGLSDRLLGDLTSPCYRDEAFVVGLCGGSVAAGVTVDRHAYLTEALAELPQTRGGEVFVVRFAIPGFKQPQQLTALAYLYSLGVRFDVVVNLDGFNEVALHPRSNKRAGVFAAFPRSWSVRHRVRENPILFGATVGVQARRAWLARDAQLSALRWSFVYQVRWHIAENALEAELAMLLADKRPVPVRSAQLGPERAYATDDAMFDDLTAIWKRSSQQMHALCTANGATYIHLLQPNQYVEGSKILTPEEHALAWDENSPYRPSVAAGYPRLIEAGAELEESSVRFFDLTGLFSGIEPAVYLDDCCHLNELGQELLSEELVRVVADAL